MNIHKVIDHFLVDLSILPLIKGKLFWECAKSPSYEGHLQAMTLEIPEIQGESFYEVRAKTLVGDLEAGFHVAQWKGEGFPVLIYHHGNKERPFNYGFFSVNTFKWILFSRKNVTGSGLFRLSRKDISRPLWKLLSSATTSCKIFTKLIEFIVF